MFEIEWIRGCVKKGEYYLSKHGDQERQNDNLTIAEVEEALLTGRVLEQYEDTGRGESYLVAGFTEGGKPRRWRGLWGERKLVSSHNCLYSSPTEIQDVLPER